MCSWSVIEKAIPRGSAEAIAEMMGVSTDLILKWRREAESDEAPTGTGRRSVHDRERDFLRAVHSENPQGARLLVEDLVAFFLQLEAKQGRGSDAETLEEIESRLRSVQLNLIEAIESLEQSRKMKL